jgi:hypothetical protein
MTSIDTTTTDVVIPGGSTVCIKYGGERDVRIRVDAAFREARPSRRILGGGARKRAGV